jgi:pimeloyl-ACP methyl ester carboxylesterase
MADQDKVCMINGQGHCASDGKCENGAFASVFTPAPGVNIPVNGWNLLNLSNFFATRDNFRQQVVTHGQLARILQHTGTGNLGQQTGITIDATKINYVGQSLGGVLGTLYSAVAPEVKNAALNVPGGDVFTVLNTSPAFAPQKAAVQAALAAQGIAPNSPAYDFFTGILRWIIDPADPINAGPYLVRQTRNGQFPADPLANNGENRRGYIQWIQDDQVIPNLSTQELIRSVVADPSASGVMISPTPDVPRFWAKRFPTSGTPANNHGFLLGSAGAATAQAAQGEVAGFVAGAPPF